MAAQVEVQAGEVGRTGVGGRLHLSPLTDSSNKSLVEIPSINQSHIIAPEPNKPVPGPKPRLSPKPFSVERNPTIKPILAPKPNPKPRPESTLPPGQKPELPHTPKQQQQPAATGKPRLASTNSNLPTNTTLKTSNKLSSGQTTKPVVHPFKPAPPLFPEDPSKPIPPVPTLKQRPSASSLAYAKSFKQLPAAEWSGSTNNEAEKDKMTPSKGAPSIARAKSMGSLDLVGQEEEVNKKTKPEAAVPIRPRPRGSRPRPVSAIFLDSPTKTETTPPGAHWVARRPLSADLTSKFESIGLSLHRKSPKENTKENTPEEEATQPQKTQQDKTPKSATPQITDVEAKQTVSDQSTKKTEEPTVKKHGDDEKRAASSIKKRISLLLDSSSSSSPGVTGLMSDVHASGQATPETEPAVDVKQLIKQLTEDTTPTQSPVLKPPLKPRPLPLDLTKRFTSERSSDPGSLSEATDRNDISRDPQARNEEAAVTPSDQLNQASPDEGAHDGQMFGSTPKDCGPGRDVQKVRASLFENVVERHSVMMMTDDGKAANKETDSPRSPLLRRESSNEGTLVTATYKEPVSPSSPLRVLHAFDTVQAVDESRAVSEIVPSAQREDKAMTLRSRRSEGNRPVEEKKTESGSAVMPEQQPRYLRVGALPKWTNTGLEQYPSKEPLVEGQVASDTDRDRQMDAEQEEAAAAPKRLKMLQADEQPKPRATYFALTGQMQEPASPSTDANMPFDDLSVRSVLGSSQGKILPVRRNPSLDEAFAKSSDDQVQDSIMKSHVPHEEMRSAFNRHVIEDDGMMETEKKRELKKEAERHRAKMKELEREKQRQLELEKERHLEFERMKERERQREHERQRQKAFEREKQEFEEKQRALELQRQMELENQRLQELERERHHSQLEKEKRRELERQRKNELEKLREQEKESQREQERQRQREEERQRELDRESQLLEIQKEKQRMEELERQQRLQFQKQKQKERERMQVIELERQRLKEKMEREEAEKLKQMALEQEMLRLREIDKESERQREMEREKQRELERKRQKELDRERQELENQRLRQRELERERQRKEEAERMKEMERRQLLELEKQKQAERERQQILELEKQRLREKMERENADKMRLIAKQQEAERQRLREKMEREEAEKLKQMALEQEMLRLREIDKESERQREMEREKQRELEREKQRELERKRQKELDRERQRQLDIEMQELENQRLRQREQEKERQRKEEAERMKEMERRQLLEFEKQKQAEKERQQILELEKQRLREKMERENADKMRLIAKQQEAERQRLREKQRIEEQERAAFEASALRPKVADESSPQRSSPSTRWKEPSPRAEELYRHAVFDKDSFTSHAQLSPGKDLFPVSGIQSVDAGFGGRSQPSPERDVSWKVPAQTSVGFSSPVWTTSPQDPWELRPVDAHADKPMAEPRKPDSKLSPEQLLLRLHDERVQAPQRNWSAAQDELLHLGPFAGTEAETSAEPLWHPTVPQAADSRASIHSHRRSQGAQELNRMRSRSMSRRSAPSTSVLEGSLLRMRSRSAHREQDSLSWEQQKQKVGGEEDEQIDSETPVRETDSQYGTWETGLRTDDSLTPATPSSESTLSPSPRKPTPPDTPGEPSPLYDTDAVDSLPPSSSAESQPFSFPDVPVTLLDTSALRSRAHLGKKRAPRSRPTRTALQSAAPADEWLYRDSTEPKAEVKDEESDSEEPTRGADAASAVASQPQRIAMFPGMDPSVLKAQLRKRADSDNQTDGPASSSPKVSRSPKSPFLPRAARVLPPPGGKENGEEESPQWLKELKSKKRLSQYENES